MREKCKVRGAALSAGNKSIRLCILTEFFYPDSASGTGKVVSEIARKLADEHGFQVDVLTGRRGYLSGEILERQTDWDGVRIWRGSFPNWNRQGVLKRTLGNLKLVSAIGSKILKSKPYDVILTTTAPPFMPMAARLAKHRRGTPFAYLIYDLEPDRATRIGAVDAKSRPTLMLRRAQRKWLNDSDAVIAIGRCMKALIEREYGVDPSRVEFVPVGAPVSGFEPAIGSEGKLTIVYSGNLGRYHDFDTLLDASKKLDPNRFSIRIVGKGAKREHIESRLAMENFPNVTISDPLELKEYQALLAETDVAFVTMEEGIEGTCVPSKFYSIMASGKATVAVAGKESELAYTIQENDCGIVVAPGDREGLVAAFEFLANDRDRCRNMGLRAREAFAEKYSTDKTIAQLAAVLTKIAQHK